MVDSIANDSQLLPRTFSYPERLTKLSVRLARRTEANSLQTAHIVKSRPRSGANVRFQVELNVTGASMNPRDGRRRTSLVWVEFGHSARIHWRPLSFPVDATRQFKTGQVRLGIP